MSTKGCGGKDTCGHGVFEFCGEPDQSGETYYCRECLIKQKEQLIAALQLAVDRLKFYMRVHHDN